MHVGWACARIKWGIFYGIKNTSPLCNKSVPHWKIYSHSFSWKKVSECWWRSEQFLVANVCLASSVCEWVCVCKCVCVCVCVCVCEWVRPVCERTDRGLPALCLSNRQPPCNQHSQRTNGSFTLYVVTWFNSFKRQKPICCFNSNKVLTTFVVV